MGNKVLNPSPLTVEVMDLDGKNHVLTGRVVSRKTQGEFNRAVFEEAVAQPLADQQAFQASYIFDKPMEFWDNFDVRVITRAVKVYLADMQNPTS